MMKKKYENPCLSICTYEMTEMTNICLSMPMDEYGDAADAFE